ncbi:MAG: NAD(P)-binding protein [Bacteroidaceae bacterium]|nr:NAD(P)-binding protein [Bacteroidaceae bacterium]
MKKKIAVIGAGVSGLTAAHFLRSRYLVTVYEKESEPGGLIRCRRMEDGSLFHICGGHVFNSKRPDVLDWFWSIFDRDKDFIKAERNAVIVFDDGQIVPYPIENHAYFLPVEIQQSFISDLLKMNLINQQPTNFEEFLKMRFGDTLYQLYFGPYNEKIWKQPLNKVPLGWLEGKLPMPTAQEIVFNNMNHVEEKKFVHSSFWYEKYNGSQFLADTLARGLDVRYNTQVNRMWFDGKCWTIDSDKYDACVFCGNVKDLLMSVRGVDLSSFTNPVEQLDYHGTTSVFCSISTNPYSWVYQPSKHHGSHRIICTGNFSPTNNGSNSLTATVEFTDRVAPDSIVAQLRLMPFSPKLLDYHYSSYTYPIQDCSTRMMIGALKQRLAEVGMFLTGRFADWEYYNMDMAMGAAMDTTKNITI